MIYIVKFNEKIAIIGGFKFEFKMRYYNSKRGSTKTQQLNYSK